MISILDDSLLSTTFEIISSAGLVKGDQIWANYIKGTIHQYRHELPSTQCALNCVIASNVPIGSGLSSSAALE